MKRVYIVSTEGEVGEAQGAFDEDKKVMDIWSSNDATWRNEYFSGFMAKLGVETIDNIPAKLQIELEKKLVKHCKKEWGI